MGNATGNPPKAPLYRIVSCLLSAIDRCEKKGNEVWEQRHIDRLRSLISDWLPHGSGFDTGTEIDWEASTPERLVFTFSYHHMNSNGFYTHWTEHKAVIKPSLEHGFTLKITRGRRCSEDMLGYFYQVWHDALTYEHEQYGS